MSTELIVIIALGVWLLILTIVLYLNFKSLARLNAQVGKKNFVELLNKLLVQEKENKKTLTDFRSDFERIQKELDLNVQKIGLVRFNPFKQLGGDQSFSLALLDAHDTGIILTGLHTRQKTRLYVKYISGGKSKYDLSTEEVRAIKEATKGK